MMIRDAEPQDLEALVSLGERMHAECETAFPPVEKERASQHLLLAQERPDTVLVVVAESENGIVGMLTAMAGDYAFSSEKRAMCDVWYVAPEHRGGFAAFRLVRRYLSWAIRAGAGTALIGTSTGIETARTEALMAHLGFSALGRTFRMEL